MAWTVALWYTLLVFTVNYENYIFVVRAKFTTERVGPIDRTLSVSTRSLCQTGLTKVNGKTSCKSKLIFQELFYKLNKWQIENKFSGDPHFEFSIYSNNKSNVFVNNGFLCIRPTLTEERYGPGYVMNPKGLDFGEECTGISGTTDCVQKPRAWQILPPVISAQISTKNYFSFVYGNIEVRAKFPKGDWLYPEISLVSKDQYYGPGLQSGRLYVASAGGNKNLSTLLWSGGSLGYSKSARTFAMRYVNFDEAWYNDFHVYKLQWKLDCIILYVDKEVYGTIYPPYNGFANEPSLMLDLKTTQKWQEGTFLAPFDREMYIVIGVGVGGGMFHEDLEEQVKIKKPWEDGDPKAQLNFYKKSAEWLSTWNTDSQFIVDYVKVWAI